MIQWRHQSCCKDYLDWLEPRAAASAAIAPTATAARIRFLGFGLNS